MKSTPYTRLVSSVNVRKPGWSEKRVAVRLRQSTGIETNTPQFLPGTIIFSAEQTVKQSLFIEHLTCQAIFGIVSYYRLLDTNSSKISLQNEHQQHLLLHCATTNGS